MGCCNSKAAMTVDGNQGIVPVKHEGVAKENLPTKHNLTKTSHGSSTIQVGALDVSVKRSCCSNDEPTVSETSQASEALYVTVQAGSGVAVDHKHPVDGPSCEEPDAMREAVKKARRAGLDDENKLEFEDMESTSEEGDRGLDLTTTTTRLSSSQEEDDACITQCIIEAMKASLLFQGITETILETLSTLMKREVYDDGDVIIRQGDMPKETDCMYYVSKGEVELCISGSQSEKQQVIPKKSGWIFGDLALLFSSPRTASVVAKGTCVLYALGRSDFISVAKNVAEIRLLRFLRKLPRLKTVSDTNLIAFGKNAEIVTYPKDQSMTVDEDMIYIVRKGKVRRRDPSSSDPSSHVLTRGNFFGAEQTNVYETVTDVEVVSVRQSAYQELGGADLYLQILEEAVLQILQVIWNNNSNSSSNNMKSIDISDVVRKHPLITARRHDRIVSKDESIKHLYIVVRGEIEINKKQDMTTKNQALLQIRRHNGVPFFGERCNQKFISDVDVVVASDKIQLLKIPHELLLKAGIEERPAAAASNNNNNNHHCRERSSGLRLAHRVVDAHPLTYDGPEINFKDLRQYRVVGEGEYGAVRLVCHKPTGDVYALKVMHKSAIKDSKTAEHVIMERKMLVRLDGYKFLVGLRGAYQDEKSIYLLMDWVPGGELFSRIIDCGGRLPDSHAIFYAANVVLAYAEMHRLNIIYRDLKPENMLIDKNGYLKLADYGFATVSDGSAWTVCGTPDYQAPEIISRQGASKASDFWALGVLIYEMLTGDAPFKSPTDDRWDTHRRILSGRYYIPEYVSKGAADLITKLLQVDPKKRLGCHDDDLDEVMRHPWFKKIDWKGLQQQTLGAPFVPNLASGIDTSCFDYYESPTEPKVPAARNNFFGRDQPWSCLWSWIDEF